MFSEELIL